MCVLEKLKQQEDLNGSMFKGVLEMDCDTGFENMHYKLNLKEFLEDIKENITFKEI